MVELTGLAMKQQLTVALTKGRILKETLPLLRAAGLAPLEDVNHSRKLVFESEPDGIRLVILRGSDVPPYVRHGAAVLGIVGDDLLLVRGCRGLL